MHRWCDISTQTFSSLLKWFLTLTTQKSQLFGDVTFLTNQLNWDRNRKYIVNTITTLRSNKSASLMWTFFGKWFAWIVLPSETPSFGFVQIGYQKQQQNPFLKSPEINQENLNSSLFLVWKNSWKVGVILKLILSSSHTFCLLLERRHE